MVVQTVAVPLPTRTPTSKMNFVGSRETAVNRFKSLERKLLANPKLQLLYSDFMSDYPSQSHMSVATSPGQYFIPNHAVPMTLIRYA